MVITFNYKEGTTTITFDDLKAALDGKNMGSDLDCLTAPQSVSEEMDFFLNAKTAGSDTKSGWFFVFFALLMIVSFKLA